MENEVCEVIITAPDAGWLANFVRRCVDNHLCASGHNITPIRSVYRWHGVTHDETEARVALHTRRGLVAALIRRVRDEHPYEVPCVIVLPIVDGNPDYIQWIVDETDASPPREHA